MEHGNINEFLPNIMKSDHEALEAERHQSAKLCDEVGRMKAENSDLKAQLDQFHAAMEREKSGEWWEQLTTLARQLDKYADGYYDAMTMYDMHRAARELRETADIYTHKANFVPRDLEIKELKSKLEQRTKELAIAQENFSVTNGAYIKADKACAEMHAALKVCPPNVQTHSEKESNSTRN